MPVYLFIGSVVGKDLLILGKCYILCFGFKQYVVDGHVEMRKKLYVPRVEDKNSHMRMLNISRIDDLIANSMNILEPASVDADGNEREDGIFFFHTFTSEIYGI